MPDAGGDFSPTRWWLTFVVRRTPDCLKHQRLNAEASSWFPELSFLPPETAFSMEAVKKASEKNSRDPEKMTLALFLACSPAIRRVFFPAEWGYSVIGSSGLWLYAEKDAVKISITKGLFASATNPVPWYSKGLGFFSPTIWGALTTLLGSATIKVCLPSSYKVKIFKISSTR